MKKLMLSVGMLCAFLSTNVMAAVEFNFVQSQEIASPAATGLKRGMVFGSPVERKNWPGDIMKSVPESRVSKTDLAMKYAADHSYPAYVFWVRAGNAFSVIMIMVIAGLAFYASRSPKHA